MAYGISRPLVEFIHRYLRTMDHVEILLCLHRPPEPRSLASLVEDTRLAESRAKAVIQELVTAGLIVASDATFLAVRSDDHESLLAELAEAYNSTPVALVRAIYSRPSPIQSFADAFRLRKDKPEAEEQ
jgi:hypothetical protein